MTTRRRKVAPPFRQPLRRWDVGIALERQYRRWLGARDRAVESCIADILGDRTRSLLVEVKPRHAMTQHADPFRGIDRTAHPSSMQWASSNAEPFSFETFRTAIRRIIAHKPPPPIRPWISRARADELLRDGVSRHLLELAFEIY